MTDQNDIVAMRKGCRMESETPRTDAESWGYSVDRAVDFARQLERELAAAKAELLSRTDELATAIKQRDEARRDRAAYRMEIYRLIEQRNDARRMVCWFAAKEIVVENAKQFIQEPTPTPAQIALERGWDCYEEKEGGGA